VTHRPDSAQNADIRLLVGMLDTMSDHIFMLKAEGDRYRLVYCNKAMDNFMNQGPEPLTGKYLDELVPNPETYQRIAENYSRAREAGGLIRYEESTEGFDFAPLTVFETTLSPLTGLDGQSVYICGISRNITARRKAEAALKTTNEVLKQQLAENERLHEQLRQEAIRDPLTNLFNRRYFMESLNREFGRAQREGYPLTLMMVDLDHFKQLNDQYGHSVGDQALVDFSNRLAHSMRREDVVCRWGGEEFLAMMPGLSLDAACQRINTWHAHHSPVPVQVGHLSLNLRFSIGLATAPEQGATPDILINAADTALYRAKATGRNQVQVFG